MLAELKSVGEQIGRPVAPSPVPRDLKPETTLEERIRRDPPIPGIHRFYNTRFRMPERTRRGD